MSFVSTITYDVADSLRANETRVRVLTKQPRTKQRQITTANLDVGGVEGISNQRNNGRTKSTSTALVRYWPSMRMGLVAP